MWINLSQNENLLKIHNYISEIKSETVKSLFKKLFKTIKQNIILKFLDNKKFMIINQLLFFF